MSLSVRMRAETENLTQPLTSALTSASMAPTSGLTSGLTQAVVYGCPRCVYQADTQAKIQGHMLKVHRPRRASSAASR